MRDPNVLHFAAQFGETKKIVAALKAKIEVNGLGTVHKSPLCFVSHLYAYRLHTYTSILLLLEAGANPLQIHYTCSAGVYREISPLIEVIDSHHLALARLYLWYIPADFDYLSLPILVRVPITCSLAEGLPLEEAAEDRFYGIKRDFARWIKETATDAQRATRLKAEAHTYEVRAEYAEAAMAYATVAKLYAKHEALETAAIKADAKLSKKVATPEADKGKLAYYLIGADRKDNALPTDYCPILIAHYRAKRVEFLKRAEECFKKLEGRYPSAESIRAYGEVQVDFADCHAKRDAVYYAFLARAAEVLVKSPEVVSSPAPLLVSSAAAGSILVDAVPVVSAPALAGAGAPPVKRASDTSTLSLPEDEDDETDTSLLLTKAAATGVGDSSGAALGRYGLYQRKVGSGAAAPASQSAVPAALAVGR